MDLLGLLKRARGSELGARTEKLMRKSWAWRGVQMFRPRMLYDVCGRPHPRRALLSYVLGSFYEDETSPQFLRHSNLWETRAIASILDELGYVVDVADCFGRPPRIRYPYDLCLDIGLHLPAVAPHLPTSCKRILYATGRHWLAQNAAEYERLADLKGRRGVVLAPRRQVPCVEASSVADALFYIGDDLTLDTYRHVVLPAHRIRASCPDLAGSSSIASVIPAKRHFMWLGSSGMVLKGLDLVLEVFAQMPELTLHVVGPVHAEPDFVDAYRQELTATPNIKVHDYVSVGGAEFAALAARCVAVVYPSGSEGVPGSVLSAMMYGLVPIVSKQCGLEFGDAGTVLPDCALDSIRTAVHGVVATSDPDLRAWRQRARSFVREQHSRAVFEADMRRALGTITSP
jgi:glycosyltransferase involved in cell wall biosynthesis